MTLIVGGADYLAGLRLESTLRLGVGRGVKRMSLPAGLPDLSQQGQGNLCSRTVGMGKRPSASSWVDGLLAGIERLPWPPWVTYLGMTVGLALLGHVVRWLEGSAPLWRLDPARLAEAPLAVITLALMHSLNRAAVSAFRAFRPILSMGDSEAERLREEMTTVPPVTAWIATGVGIVGGLASVASSPASWGVVAGPITLSTVYIGAFASLMFVFTSLLLAHTVRQLRLVTWIHGRAAGINLWQRQPVYAFSTLTARTGIGLILITYYFLFIAFGLGLLGEIELTALDAAAVALFLVVATASFVLPLAGMQRTLTREKRRLIAEADRRFEQTLDRLHVSVDSGGYDALDGLNKALSGLLIEREALAKIPTWPWRPETLRGFLSSIAAPILLWLATQWLGRALGLG